MVTICSRVQQWLSFVENGDHDPIYLWFSEAERVLEMMSSLTTTSWIEAVNPPSVTARPKPISSESVSGTETALSNICSNPVNREIPLWSWSPSKKFDLQNTETTTGLCATALRSFSRSTGSGRPSAPTVGNLWQEWPEAWRSSRRWATSMHERLVEIVIGGALLLFLLGFSGVAEQRMKAAGKGEEAIPLEGAKPLPLFFIATPASTLRADEHCADASWAH